VRVLLISTYELGHQPLQLASPAAALEAAGHEVGVLDVAVDAVTAGAVSGYDAIAISVPMHTATRLARDVISRLADLAPGVPVAMYGLYAGEGSPDLTAARFVGEYEPDLVDWVSTGAGPVGIRISVRTGTFHTPVRRGLPPLDRYGRLEMEGEQRVVGYVEASHGCRHRCRHCPIPAVYDGRYRIVGSDAVAADIDAQVVMGARHITWGDPDFFNGPRHSLSLLEDVHRRHPELTHDLTIKVEHLCEHADLIPRLAAAGTIFVVSAFETTDDRTLALLDKGHTASDMSQVVADLRRHRIDVHPSWMPFVPWTTPEDVVDIFRFLADHDLLGSTDPVQLSIRLLIPRGSLMLDLDEVADAVDGYDEELLSYRWRSSDPRSDELQRRLAATAEAASESEVDPMEALLDMWAQALEVTGGDPGVIPDAGTITGGRPRLTESWFCCAEPTSSQTGALRSR
jgi:radical SAM superfamily enzyme YgiQ (UPF0313 family)